MTTKFFIALLCSSFLMFYAISMANSHNTIGTTDVIDKMNERISMLEFRHKLDVELLNRRIDELVDTIL